ncbi:hypothetical protein DH2020_041893 [Rehmannia glutinosa]|uniref:RNase H type-1 domain-containing protein n=1 Tax=Rehmannia glutinosa TaxID=99300 RepID=A0ABR0UNX5_REHGL
MNAPKQRLCLHELENPKSCFPLLGSKYKWTAQISWSPGIGWHKINIDGAKKSTVVHGGVGGVLRDWNGDIKWAYADSIPNCNDSLLAEVFALYKMLLLLNVEDTPKIWIETDSMTLLNTLNHNLLGNWRIQHLLIHIRSLLIPFEVHISHIFRKGNQVADLLANIGFSTQSYNFYTSNNIPRRILGMARVDQPGIPNFRIRYRS